MVPFLFCGWIRFGERQIGDNNIVIWHSGCRYALRVFIYFFGIRVGRSMSTYARRLGFDGSHVSVAGPLWARIDMVFFSEACTTGIQNTNLPFSASILFEKSFSSYFDFHLDFRRRLSNRFESPICVTTNLRRDKISACQKIWVERRLCHWNRQKTTFLIITRISPYFFFDIPYQIFKVFWMSAVVFARRAIVKIDGPRIFRAMKPKRLEQFIDFLKKRRQNPHLAPSKFR